MSPITHENEVTIAVDEVRRSADFINEELTGHYVSVNSFNFCQNLYRRAFFAPVANLSPSLEYGIGDGFASFFMHRGKTIVDWGGETPTGTTTESYGISPPIQFDHFKQTIGMDLEHIPFPDNTFASVTTAHTMHLGQNLFSVISEVLRVLVPGGTCTYACDLDQWFKFESLKKLVLNAVPTFSAFSQDYHLQILAQAGAVEIRSRTFFPAALEAVVVAISNKVPARFNAILASEVGEGGDVDDLVKTMHDVFCTLLEQELSRPEGPEDGFHVFVSFKKSGNLPANIPAAQPACPACHSVLTLEVATLRCSTCGDVYSEIGGVPMLLLSTHTAIRNNTNWLKAVEVSRRLELELTELLPQLEGPFYIIYDGISPLPGHRCANILISLLQQNHIRIAGIVALSVTTVSSWKGHSIVNDPSKLLAGSKFLLLSSDVQQADRWIAKIRSQSVTGTFYSIYWADGQSSNLRVIEF